MQYVPISIASPPVFRPDPSTQAFNTATAASDTSIDVAMADDLPGFSSNCTVQSPRTTAKSDDRIVSEEEFLLQHPHSLFVETEDQRPMCVGQQSVRRISTLVCCV